jgi:DNA-binding response OmpR family regulator
MVVDDDPEIRLIVEAALTEKYEVCHAHDGLDALEKLDKYEPDFVILDLLMPLMSGTEVCESIRRNSKFQNMQVLFLSAHDTREEIQQAYASGGNLFLSKPIDPARLLRNINVFFDNAPLPPRSKKLSIIQVRMLDQLEEEVRPHRLHQQPATPQAKVPPRAMAPQVGQRQHKTLERREAPAPSPHPASNGLTPTRPRVLVVEDDKDMAELIVLSLEDAYEVTVAPDGLDAVEKLVRYQPDILLIDVMLPRMNGYQLCQSVRANRAFCEMPIYFVTAKNAPKDRDYALRIGGDGVLGKPFEMDELLGICREAQRKPGFYLHPKQLSFEEIRAQEHRNAKEAAVMPKSKQPFDRPGLIQ